MKIAMRKFSLVLAAMILLSAVFVMGGGFQPAPKVAAQSAAEQEEPKVQPRGGGQGDYTFRFDKGYVQFSVTAENWWWPAIDQAIVTVMSDASGASYRFTVEFVWTNGSGSVSCWDYPLTDRNVFRSLTEQSGSFYYKQIVQNCKGSGTSGNPGSGWACEYINIYLQAKISTEPVQSAQIFSIHF